MPITVGVRRALLRRSTAVAGADTTPPSFSSSEEGNVTNLTVVARFSEPISSPTADYLTGVTVKVGGVGVTLNSGTLQGDTQTVYYVIANGSEADPDDAITWEYSSALGDIEDLSANALEDVTAQAVENNVGEHWRFTHKYNSMQLAAL